MRRLVVLASLAACGGHESRLGGDAATVDSEEPSYDCAAETRADPFAPGLDKPGANHQLGFKLVAADPATLVRGDNTWTLQLLAGGTGVSGATLAVTPFMPDHAHGTPIQVDITDLGDGIYELRPVNLWMPGLWQTTIQATSASASDSAVFSFCLSN